ncbi:hypothetical protein ACOSP6_08095 [Tenacibaculum sp. MEBiC06402]|uniref:hypothetical protein n=1 Tax=unclassified Tenacibaculum TaxID=2635139 RepID=UPI003B9B224E
MNSGNSSEFSKEELIKIALDKVNVESSNTEFISAQVFPGNKNETLIVIPEVVNKEEDMYELNSHIFIINNKTGVISHKFFEPSKESGWVSDAIYIADIKIDTTTYKLSSTHKAFGIIIQYVGSSQPNPYSRKDISLFTKHNAALKKVLDSYTLQEESGVVNVSSNACYSNINKTVNKLIVTDSVTNGFYDLSVKNVISKLESFRDKNDDCEVKEEVISIKSQVLKFNGNIYKR